MCCNNHDKDPGLYATFLSFNWTQFTNCTFLQIDFYKYSFYLNVFTDFNECQNNRGLPVNIRYISYLMIVDTLGGMNNGLAFLTAVMVCDEVVI